MVTLSWPCCGAATICGVFLSGADANPHPAVASAIRSPSRFIDNRIWESRIWERRFCERRICAATVMLHCNAGRYGAIKRYLMLCRQIARLLGGYSAENGASRWLDRVACAPAFPRRAESASGASISRGRMEDEFGGTPGWRNGRRRGLKIPWSESPVRVRVPPPAA